VFDVTPRVLANLILAQLVFITAAGCQNTSVTVKMAAEKIMTCAPNDVTIKWE
jgi:hypothetical protein